MTRVAILSATVRDQRITAATAILQTDGEQSVTATKDAEGGPRLPESDAQTRSHG